MLNLKPLLLSAAAILVLTSGAYAAEQSYATHDQRVADTDFGKLSVEGSNAYRDIELTRLALFQDEPSKAKTFIEDAKTAIQKAQTDDSVFIKAESELRAPGKTISNPDTKRIAWLPVDGQMIMDENFVASPQKSAAIAEANKSFNTGNRKGAVDKLKAAGIDIDFTLAVVPLAKTTGDIDQASALIAKGKYYEANAMLLQAERGVRFDMAQLALPAKNQPAKR